MTISNHASYFASYRAIFGHGHAMDEVFIEAVIFAVGLAFLVYSNCSSTNMLKTLRGFKIRVHTHNSQGHWQEKSRAECNFDSKTNLLHDFYQGKLRDEINALTTYYENLLRQNQVEHQEWRNEMISKLQDKDSTIDSLCALEISNEARKESTHLKMLLPHSRQSVPKNKTLRYAMTFGTLQNRSSPSSSFHLSGIISDLNTPASKPPCTNTLSEGSARSSCDIKSSIFESRNGKLVSNASERIQDKLCRVASQPRSTVSSSQSSRWPLAIPETSVNPDFVVNPPSNDIFVAASIAADQTTSLSRATSSLFPDNVDIRDEFQIRDISLGSPVIPKLCSIHFDNEADSASPNLTSDTIFPPVPEHPGIRSLQPSSKNQTCSANSKSELQVESAALESPVCQLLEETRPENNTQHINEIEKETVSSQCPSRPIPISKTEIMPSRESNIELSPIQRLDRASCSTDGEIPGKLVLIPLIAQPSFTEEPNIMYQTNQPKQDDFLKQYSTLKRMEADEALPASYSFALCNAKNNNEDHEDDMEIDTDSLMTFGCNGGIAGREITENAVDFEKALDEMEMEAGLADPVKENSGSDVEICIETGLSDENEIMTNTPQIVSTPLFVHMQKRRSIDSTEGVRTRCSPKQHAPNATSNPFCTKQIGYQSITSCSIERPATPSLLWPEGGTTQDTGLCKVPCVTESNESSTGGRSRFAERNYRQSAELTLSNRNAGYHPAQQELYCDPKRSETVEFDPHLSPQLLLGHPHSSQPSLSCSKGKSPDLRNFDDERSPSVYQEAESHFQTVSDTSSAAMNSKLRSSINMINQEETTAPQDHFDSLPGEHQVPLSQQSKGASAAGQSSNKAKGSSSELVKKSHAADTGDGEEKSYFETLRQKGTGYFPFHMPKNKRRRAGAVER